MDTNPDIPIETLVTELEDLCFNDPFVEGVISGTYVRLCISIHALQTLFEYACQQGIIVPDSDVFYRRGGQLRRYKRAKKQKGRTQEEMGTSEGTP